MATLFQVELDGDWVAAPSPQCQEIARAPDRLIRSR